MLKSAYQKGVEDACVRLKIAVSAAKKQKLVQSRAEQRGYAATAKHLEPGNALNEVNTLHRAMPANTDGFAHTRKATNADLLERGYEKLPGLRNAARRFFSGQGAHAHNLLQGAGALSSKAGRGLAWQSVKGLAPSLGVGAGALLLGSRLLSND